MNQGIEIKESEFKQTSMIKKVHINIHNVTLHKSCYLTYSLVDTTDRVIKNDSLFIEGAEYTAWNTDDNYIEDLVLSKLGYTKAI